MTPPKGPFAVALAILASPWMRWALLLWIGLGALVGLAAWPGVHPAEGLLLHVPVALLPWSVGAAALTVEGRGRIASAAVAVGLALAFVGALLAGGGAGWARLGAKSATESWLREDGRRPVPVHLGGQLEATPGEGGLELALGVPKFEMATARVAHDGREQPLGPWAVHLHDRRPGSEPTRARVRIRSREGEEGTEHLLRVGNATVAPDGTQVYLRRLTPDFGRALGPAAQLTLSTDDRAETAWYFVADPDLDARTSERSHVVELLAVEAEPVWILGVRRSGPAVVALAGWALVAVAWLFGLGRRRSTQRVEPAREAS